MGFRVVWSPEALDDVDSIAGYISRDSAFYARVVVEKVLEAARNLAAFPYAGRIVPEFGVELLRETFVYSYRLIYEIAENRVLVVAVIHGKRSFNSGEAQE